MSDESAPPAGPKLFHRLRKSISGQNLAKAHSGKEEHHEEGVPEEADVAAETEAKDDVEPATATDGGEDTTNGEITNGLNGDAVKEKEEDVVKDEAEVTGTHDDGATNDDADEHKEHKVTGLQRLKNLAKFNRDKGRAATPPTSDHHIEAGDASAVDDHAATANGDTDTKNGELSSSGDDGNHSASASLDDAVNEDNDPTALADRIRSLIQSLPQPTKSIPAPSKPKLPQLDADGRPIPPKDAVHSHDTKLIAMLRNPSIMNGRIAHHGGEGEDKPTVWAILDSFQAPTAQTPDDEGKDGSTGPIEDGDADDDGDSDTESDDGSEVGEPPHIILDDSSVMLYAPLIPTKESKVEMADSQIVPITSSTNGAKLAASVKEQLGDVESNVVDMLSPGQYRMYGTFGRRGAPPVVGVDSEPPKETQPVQTKISWKFWPWRKKKASVPAPTTPDTTAPPSGDDKDKAPVTAPTPAPTTPDTTTPAPGDDKDKAPATTPVPAEGDQKKKRRPHKLRKPKPILDQRIWVPSRTDLSIQALWWGYRIFLPPPVLAVLSDKTIEATKRAAMITTALSWLFSHLPLTMFPAPMQPAIIMLQQLVPYLGYIGTFITWSWSMIQSYDVGYGVILSATWILPVALIPGTWQAYDFPADGGSTTPVPGKPSTTPAPGQPSTGNPAPSQPSTGAPAPTQPSTGAPTTPSTGAPTPPSTGPPAQPSTGTPAAPPPAQPTTGTPESGNTPIGTEPPTNDTTPPPPTVSTRLRMVKAIDKPADRLAKIKGDGTIPVVDESGSDVVEEEKKSQYGFWKYITG